MTEDLTMNRGCQDNKYSEVNQENGNSWEHGGH